MLQYCSVCPFLVSLHVPKSRFHLFEKLGYDNLNFIGVEHVCVCLDNTKAKVCFLH